MGRLRRMITVVSAACLLPLTATAAQAAPPANDEVAGAVALTLGGTVTQDTTQATTTAGDAALNAGCGAPATKASVWFSYTPDRDRRVVFDMRDSDYSGGVLIFEGSAAADKLVACGPGAVALAVEGGTTYFVMAISDTDVNGGTLVLSLRVAPPPPRVRLSLGAKGSASRAGAARIRGTYRCTGGESAVIFGSLVQRVGRLKIPADFGKEVACDGRQRNWSARLVSATGIYDRGPARATVAISGCGLLDCTERTVSRKVLLVRVAGPRGRRTAPTVDRVQRPRPGVDPTPRWGSAG